jgi:hypothetical protein
MKKSRENAGARVIASDVEIDAAIARANERDVYRPYVVAASYREADDVVVLVLASGVWVAIPRQMLQGLEGAEPKALAQIEIEGPGTGLHWRALDVDHYVPALLAGVFGTRAWMAEIGRKGGAARSSAKAAASRTNGRRGGRPPTQRSAKKLA